MWKYQSTDELYHHGILGMKWGIRRYQNPDGSLTPAGRRRAGKYAKKYADLTGKKLIIKKKTVSEHKEKNVHDMSDEELRKKINRMILEKEYVRMTTPKQVQEHKVSKGKKFISYIANKVMLPAATNVGKQYVEQQLKKMLNVEDNNKPTKNVEKNERTSKQSNKGKEAIERVLDPVSYNNKSGKISVNSKALKNMSDKQYSDLISYIDKKKKK